MLADNRGYGVPSCYNGGILGTPTPRIDELAADGMKLTNFNVENQCTPRRRVDDRASADTLRHLSSRGGLLNPP
jgi:hypothetical protein